MEEEPLGKLRLTLSIFTLFLCLSSGVRAASSVPYECPRRLLDLIGPAIESVAQSRPENTENNRLILYEMEQEIARRVHRACPEPESCSPEEISEAALRAAHQVLDENPKLTSRWKTYAIFAGSTSAFMAVNAYVAVHTHPIFAASFSAMSTVLGAMALTSVGAPLIENTFARLRQLAYAADSEQYSRRGPGQKRHARIYRRTQEVITAVEEMGRYTERQSIAQINMASLACSPFPGEEAKAFRHRVAYIFATLLSDLVPKYLELDFSEAEYSKWARVLFSHWHLDDREREGFQEEVLHLIVTLFDETAKPDTGRREKYERVLRAWTAPFGPVTSPLRNHPLRIAPPSRTEAAP